MFNDEAALLTFCKRTGAGTTFANYWAKREAERRRAPEKSNK